MAYEIRESTPGDWPALVELNNAVYPDYPTTLMEFQHHEQHRDPKVRFQRWVAVRGGEIVGATEYHQPTDMYHPRKFWMELSVRPDLRHHGIGTALYDRMTGALAEHDPLSLGVNVREDMTDAVRFAERRGFTERMREWESHLDLAAFDPTPYAGAADRLRAEGIEIRSLADLEAEPDRHYKLYDLDSAAGEDVPRTDPEYTPEPFERWIERRLSSPTYYPEGMFVAVHGERYVGLTTLHPNKTNRDLDTGLTGVRREYRRKGIALALKVHALSWAKQQGYPRTKTWNASTNEGMLAINIRLGFVRQPAWVFYFKQLAEE
jgi:GNAT superfamily N-acetyltransferase